MDAEVAKEPILDGAERADVAIVGAGIAGAFHLPTSSLIAATPLSCWIAARSEAGWRYAQQRT